MNKTRIAASILGIFAGLGGGVFHGIGEILQGNVAPNGIYIQAWPAMQATSGEPAMTIVPNFLLTGILAIIGGIIVTIWAATFIERKNGGLVLILLSNNIAPIWWRNHPTHNWGNRWNYWHKN